MILFFAWTDIQVINCVNTKCNFYAMESADLLVYKRNRISEKLLQIVREKRIFTNVYTVELPDFYKKEEINKKRKFHYVILHLRLKSYFIEQLKCMVQETKYNVFLASAFWSETLNVFKYLRMYNDNISIEIIEEGMANYNGPKNWIFRAAPSSYMKSLIREIFYCGNMGRIARKKVKSFYLYRPELSWMHEDIETRTLPAITEETNPICYKMFNEWQKDIDSSIYLNSKIIFVIDAPNLKGRFYEALQSMIENLPDSMKKVTLIKRHPMHVHQGDSDISQYENGVVVDNRRVPIENILFHCNIDQKVLVVNQSSALLYLKCMLNKEPYVIFTYRMKPYSEKRLIDKFDFFTGKLREVFFDPDKIMVPNTIEEFKIAIKTIEEKII